MTKIKVISTDINGNPSVVRKGNDEYHRIDNVSKVILISEETLASEYVTINYEGKTFVKVDGQPVRKTEGDGE